VDFSSPAHRQPSMSVQAALASLSPLGRRASRERRLSKEDDTHVDEKSTSPKSPSPRLGWTKRRQRLSKEYDAHIQDGLVKAESVDDSLDALSMHVNNTLIGEFSAAAKPTAPISKEDHTDDAIGKPLSPTTTIAASFVVYAKETPKIDVSEASTAFLGAYSCGGMCDYRAKANQDCAAVAQLADPASSVLLCVFDGHGADGTAVSAQAVDCTIRTLSADAHALRTDPNAALAAAFDAVQGNLMEADKKGDLDASHSGACALVAYIHEQSVWVANAGDCVCVLATASEHAPEAVRCYSARMLSTEHKVDLPSEQKRLEKAGAWVRPAQYDEDGELRTPARLYRYQGEANRKHGPGLAISRAVGDLDANSCGLVATPEVQTQTLRVAACASGNPPAAEHDAFLILASDGCLEFMSPQDAVDIVSPIYARGGRATEACEALINRAKADWRNDDEDYRDDISVVVAFLPALITAMEVGVRFI